MKRHINGVHTYDRIEQDGKAFIKDSNGEPDFTQEVRPVRSAAQIDAYRRRMAMIEDELIQKHINVNKTGLATDESYFIFMIYKPLHVFIHQFPDMVKGDYARLIYLSTFLIRNGSKLKLDHRTTVKKSDIKDLLETSESTARRFLNRAEEAGIIDYDGYNNVRINTSILKKGDAGRNTRNRHFAKLFIQNTRLLYLEFNRGSSLEKLGTLYSLIPFIDLKYNVLCLNANKQIDDELDLLPLTMEQIGFYLGMSDIQKVKKTLLGLKLKLEDKELSMIAITTTGDDKKALITVNPYFIYRNDLTRLGKIPTHFVFTEEYHAAIDSLGRLSASREIAIDYSPNRVKR